MDAWWQSGDSVYHHDIDCNVTQIPICQWPGLRQMGTLIQRVAGVPGIYDYGDNVDYTVRDPHIIAYHNPDAPPANPPRGAFHQLGRHALDTHHGVFVAYIDIDVGTCVAINDGSRLRQISVPDFAIRGENSSALEWYTGRVVYTTYRGGHNGGDTYIRSYDPATGAEITPIFAGDDLPENHCVAAIGSAVYFIGERESTMCDDRIGITHTNVHPPVNTGFHWMQKMRSKTVTDNNVQMIKLLMGVDGDRKSIELSIFDIRSMSTSVTLPRIEISHGVNSLAL
jgi:hypothetical protein